MNLNLRALIYSIVKVSKNSVSDFSILILENALEQDLDNFRRFLIEKGGQHIGI